MTTTLLSEFVQCYNFDWLLEHVKDCDWQATLSHRSHKGLRVKISAMSFDEACDKLYTLDLQKGEPLGLSQALSTNFADLHDAIQGFFAYLASENLQRDLKQYHQTFSLLRIHAAVLGITSLDKFNYEFIERYGQSLSSRTRKTAEFRELNDLLNEFSAFLKR